MSTTPTPSPHWRRSDDRAAIVLLLSGPNLNLLGEREPEVYGTATLADHVAAAEMAAAAHDLQIEHLQSNHEGELVDAIHGARGPLRGDRDQPRRASPTTPGRSTTPSPRSTGRSIELHLSNPAARGVVAPRLGRRPGGHRHHRRARRARLPGGDRRRGPHPGVTCEAALIESLPAMDVAGRLARLRAALAAARTARRRRSSSPTSPTSATSPGSPARPRSCSCAADGDGGAGHRRSLRGAGHRRGGPGRRAGRGPHRPHRWRCSARSSSAEVGRAGLARRWRPTTSAGRTSGRYAAAWFPEVGAAWPTTARSSALRIVKDDGEVARIEAACAIADAALADVSPGSSRTAHRGGVRPGPRRRGRDLGADDLSFETIVASGPNGSRPHHTPTDRA